VSIQLLTPWQNLDRSVNCRRVDGSHEGRSAQLKQVVAVMEMRTVLLARSVLAAVVDSIGVQAVSCQIKSVFLFLRCKFQSCCGCGQLTQGRFTV
jgi:hypothetical protein